MGNWAELGEDLLALIIKRVALYEDFLSFRGVCRAWHSVAVDENFRGFEQIPWLMLSEKDNNDERQFIGLRKGGVIRTDNLPEARGKRCLETLGWLVTISEDGDMNLLHPFSRVQIGLPHVTTFKDYEDGKMKNNIIFMQKAVLSSRPEDNADFALMVIYSGKGWLGFWRPGDKIWTSIETYSTHPGIVLNIGRYGMYRPVRLGIWRLRYRYVPYRIGRYAKKVKKFTTATPDSRDVSPIRPDTDTPRPIPRRRPIPRFKTMHPGAFSDIIFHKGLFYGVAFAGRVFACDVWGPHPTMARLLVHVDVEYFLGNKSYIVESAGAILVVVRDGSLPYDSSIEYDCMRLAILNYLRLI